MKQKFPSISSVYLYIIHHSPFCSSCACGNSGFTDISYLGILGNLYTPLNVCKNLTFAHVLLTSQLLQAWPERLIKLTLNGFFSETIEKIILKQIFSNILVSRGFRNNYLMALWLRKNFATIWFDNPKNNIIV